MAHIFQSLCSGEWSGGGRHAAGTALARQVQLCSAACPCIWQLIVSSALLLHEVVPAHASCALRAAHPVAPVIAAVVRFNNLLHARVHTVWDSTVDCIGALVARHADPHASSRGVLAPQGLGPGTRLRKGGWAGEGAAAGNM